MGIPGGFGIVCCCCCPCSLWSCWDAGLFDLLLAMLLADLARVKCSFSSNGPKNPPELFLSLLLPGRREEDDEEEEDALLR